MDGVLIVSAFEKRVAAISEMLTQNHCTDIAAVGLCSEAQRLFAERDFSLLIIDAPLPDEYGANFARGISIKEVCQVILLVSSHLYDEICHKVEDSGVFTVSKPFSREHFWSALKLASAAFNKMSRLHGENRKLLIAIEDIRIIDRAKCILISHLKMDEQEAHRYVEKQAMDRRISKRAVAEGILKTYEN